MFDLSTLSSEKRLFFSFNEHCDNGDTALNNVLIFFFECVVILMSIMPVTGWRQHLSGYMQSCHSVMVFTSCTIGLDFTEN